MTRMKKIILFSVASRDEIKQFLCKRVLRLLGGTSHDQICTHARDEKHIY
jgi:hypothetical protein